ncbi:hypothetical protein halTADL_2425 [Halohasta litchfieldiae]|jgi:hypothetical protein|uniref:Uncharacterized protein n=1 Tax=Halohasta litchfieldiae TaxID=1073996 RepID=A0A1H6WTY9_9EURY|nr:hypothetical protein [Halohasta litchfieldiae]ATW89165.1 hypothetical protein halTADL_2425 [Halohasta litchfieldiae]SEJ20429.1 hypothetical protein SAMN05444271_13038 [Halohasta litchfieldiae]
MSESDSDPEPELEAEPGVDEDLADESHDTDDESELDVSDPELGKATIVFDDPDGDTTKRTVDNEHIVYFQDHWQLKTGTDADGNDVIRRIPRQRVHYVERSVEEFQDRVDAMLDQARKRLPIEIPI